MEFINNLETLEQKGDRVVIPLLCIVPSALVKPLVLVRNGKVSLPRTAPISQIQSGLWKQVAQVMDLSGRGRRHDDDSWKSDDKPVQRVHLLSYLG